MTKDDYKKKLVEILPDWLQQISDIQSKKFSKEDMLFELNENTIDVFSAAIDVYSSRLNFDDWLENEQIRQRQKSLQTKIGTLHEILITALDPNIKKKNAETVSGENKPKRIYDLYNDSDKWIAEIKNKHNTTKGDDRSASFEKLEKGLQTKNNQEYTAYYVTILRDSFDKFNKPFNPSDNKSDQNKDNQRIREVDGESFYQLVSKNKFSLLEAFDVFREVLIEHFDITEPNLKLIEEIKSLSFYYAKVKINSASEIALSYLPGFGPKNVENLIKYRNSSGKIKSLEDLIGKKKDGKFSKKIIDKIKPFVDLN